MRPVSCTESQNLHHLSPVSSKWNNARNRWISFGVTGLPAFIETKPVKQQIFHQLQMNSFFIEIAYKVTRFDAGANLPKMDVIV